ncbi:hypothetical protein MUY14_30430 [Amycolatopsis sp. FBCC-B4732]|uniref:hypothetical protein n=1 Tax=Amycolatopsis sp. FBCC-B4732 TaxID=3079339 RepID=UPI001FF361B3|nr:hypothetical protein [Amycolatopsis sp. FBCC-B4732]UOX86071.1 hypothetical protein MUY14_30430 [Amycolatopsis sp. FBCC-B4732]
MTSNPDGGHEHANNTGPVDGNVIQACQVGVVNLHPTREPDTPAAESPPPTWTPLKVLKAAGVAVLILAGSSLLPSPPDPDAIPPENGTRPAGSSNEAVLTAVQAGLASCARTQVLQQANCPQKIDDPTGQATDVHWTLHGNPIGGTYGPIWNNDRFYVAGYAVMTVTYTSPYRVPSPQSLTIQEVPYRAEITWTDNKPTVTDLRRYDKIDNSRVTKKDPALPPAQLASALRTAFHKCVAAKRSPMPPQCPSSPTAQPSDHATWTLNNDPLLGTKQTFDPKTGLTHITGSYSTTATTQNDFLGIHYSATTTDSGTYDASLTATGPTPEILQIKSL